MSPEREVFTRLSRETGALLGELGVRPEDERWLRSHAETIASLAGRPGLKSRLRGYFARWARRAARAAR
ncbi:MAG: hypothetical protein ACRD00_01385 [Thermoanaerobaculia bacterium]